MITNRHTQFWYKITYAIYQGVNYCARNMLEEKSTIHQRSIHTKILPPLLLCSNKLSGGCDPVENQNPCSQHGHM